MRRRRARHYNKYFPGNVVGMPNILQDGLVTYSDGSPATAQQYAADVTAFLMWTAEPHMEQRKRIGVQVLLFLVDAGSVSLYFTKKKVWTERRGPRLISGGRPDQT